MVVLFWNTINLLILMASLGALLERKQRRSTPRMPASVRAHFVLPTGEKIPGMVDDISSGGVRVVFDDDRGQLVKAATDITMNVWIPSMRREAEIKLAVKSVFKVGRRPAAGGEFDLRKDKEIDEIVALMYGDSESWVQFSARRTRPMPFFKALGIILRLSVPQVGAHLDILATQLKSALRRAQENLRRRVRKNKPA